MKRTSLTIDEVRQETPLHLHVRLKGASAEWVERFTGPGMKVRLAVGETEAEIGLSSAPQRRPVELLVDRDGALGKALAEAGAGASVQVSDPFGDPMPLEALRGLHLYLAGGGEGLGPIRAAVLAAIADRGHFASVRVIAEARYTDEIPYRGELPDWQRAGVTVSQVLARPDMAKWRDQEGGYAYELFADMQPEPDRSAAFVSGPDDLVEGVMAACRKAEIPPDRVFVLELDAPRRQRPPEAERLRERVDKITLEGTWGSGHQNDAPDHGPTAETPKGPPRPSGLPPYKKAERHA